MEGVYRGGGNVGSGAERGQKLEKSTAFHIDLVTRWRTGIDNHCTRPKLGKLYHECVKRHNLSSGPQNIIDGLDVIAVRPGDATLPPRQFALIDECGFRQIALGKITNVHPPMTQGSTEQTPR
ncbi:hypothetical protein Ssi03_58940 [Sphaerisporangium siamense]|nr:hypothetical protein Ssi03_58940 [Sphaerisporangium siamense]